MPSLFKLPSKGGGFGPCSVSSSTPSHGPRRPNSLCRGELTGRGRVRILGVELADPAAASLTQPLRPPGGRVQGDAALWSGEEAPPVSACVKVSCSVYDPMVL